MHDKINYITLSPVLGGKNVPTQILSPHKTVVMSQGSKTKRLDQTWDIREEKCVRKAGNEVMKMKEKRGGTSKNSDVT